MSDWIKDRQPQIGEVVEALSDDGDVMQAVFRGDEWALKSGAVWFRTMPECVRGWRPRLMVDHPDHYNQVPGIECIQVVRHFNFNLGNAIKYIWRAGHKGDILEDLEKAVWYIQDEIKRLKEGR